MNTAANLLDEVERVVRGELTHPTLGDLGTLDRSCADAVLAALRPLLASAPAERGQSLACAVESLAELCEKRIEQDGEGARLLASTVRDILRDELEAAASAPAEVSEWEEVGRTVEECVQPAHKYWTQDMDDDEWWDSLRQHLLAKLRPLWPPARLEAVRELLTDLERPDPSIARDRPIDPAASDGERSHIHGRDFGVREERGAIARRLRTALGLPKEEEHG